LREISLHIMDIVANGITAGADRIEIVVDERQAEDLLTIEIGDNGKGIPEEMLDRVSDPFVTSAGARRVGLGLPLLKAAAERCDGRFQLTSEVGKGIRVTAEFRYDHIDRAPLGDMAESIGVLVLGNPGTDFAYTHTVDGQAFTLDTREFRRRDDARSLTEPAAFRHLLSTIRDALEGLRASGSAIA